MNDHILNSISDRLIQFVNSPDPLALKKKSGLEAFFERLSGQEVLRVYLDVRNHFRKDRIDEALNLLEELEIPLAAIIQEKNQEFSAQEKAHLGAIETIISMEFPEAAHGQDREIALYFEKRNLKRMDEAKSLYLRLSRKYPDLEIRTTLLRCWRTNSPLYPMINLEARWVLGEQLIQGIRQTIQEITTSFTQAATPLELMNSLKKAQKFLPSYKPQALKILSRLVDYSQALGYHTQEFISVAKIIADYLGGGLFSRKEIFLVTPEDFNSEENPDHKPRIQTIDIHHVQFTPDDLKRILIPPQIQGTENQTLAYCRLYWEGTSDTILENLLLLYSQKHQTNHFALFQVISQGQKEGIKDELILYRIYHLLAKNARYEYNIRKDIYMQQIWAQIKPGSEVVDWEGIDKNAYAQEQARKAMSRIEEKRESARLETRKKIEKEKKLREQASLMVEKKQVMEKNRRDLAVEKTRVAIEVQRSRRKAVESALELKNSNSPVTNSRHTLTPPPLKSEGVPPGKRITKSISSRPRSEKTIFHPKTQGDWTPYNAEEVLSSRTSILERISRLESGEQKNLVLIFRRQIEHITENFVSDFAHHTGATLTNYNRSLTVLSIKDFILNNLENPNRNWALSQQRQEVKELGFNIADVEPIIESCLNQLEKTLAPMPT